MNNHSGNGLADALSRDALSIADQLTAHGLDVWCPRLDRSEYLKLTNAPHALSEVTLAEDGRLTWEYRPFHCNQLTAHRMASMALVLLAASQTLTCRPAVSPHRSQSRARHARQLLTAAGLQISRRTYDASHSEPYSEIEAVNPARPLRGRVLIADDGMLRWECRLGLTTAAGAPDLPEIASAIAKATALPSPDDSQSGQSDSCDATGLHASLPKGSPHDSGHAPFTRSDAGPESP